MITDYYTFRAEMCNFCMKRKPHSRLFQSCCEALLSYVQAYLLCSFMTSSPLASVKTSMFLLSL